MDSSDHRELGASQNCFWHTEFWHKTPYLLEDLESVFPARGRRFYHTPIFDHAPFALDFFSFAFIHQFLTGMDGPTDNYATTGIVSWI